jgi:hypothetical protein
MLKFFKDRNNEYLRARNEILPQLKLYLNKNKAKKVTDIDNINSLKNKNFNINANKIYTKIFNGIPYNEITFETDATHNLFIFLGHVGTAKKIRNPIYINIDNFLLIIVMN